MRLATRVSCAVLSAALFSQLTACGTLFYPDRRGQIDGRIALAGEHASQLPAWQEGAILSALDAITRLHERVVKT